MRNIGQHSVMDVVVCQLAEVTDSASYKRLEHKEVTCQPYWHTLLAEVCIVNLVSFFQCNIYRCTERWVWIGNLVAGFVCGIALLYGPMVNGS